MAEEPKSEIERLRDVVSKHRAEKLERERWNAEHAEELAELHQRLERERAEKESLIEEIFSEPDQSLRRKLLDEAGFKKMSAAPKPLKPVRDGGPRGPETRPAIADVDIGKAMDSLKWWFKQDTWTLRNAFLLLVELDPLRSEGITVNKDVTGFEVDYGGSITRLGCERESVFAPERAERLWGVLNVWHSRPEHKGTERFPPQYFVAWAEEKGFAPLWLQMARTVGLVPASVTPAGLDAALAARAGADVIPAIEAESIHQRQHETPEQRQDRRLAWVRGEGADHNGEKMTGARGVLAKLERAEKAAGRPMSDNSDIREDLKAAVQREREAPRPMLKGSSAFNQ